MSAAQSETRIRLVRLLGVRDMGEFLGDVWERRPLLARGAVKGVTTGILTLEDFELLMGGGALSVVDGHIARPAAGGNGDGTQLAPVFDAYRRGCTLMQSNLQQRWPPIRDLCRGIENDLISRELLLAEAVGANAYLTPPASQGFGIHYDDHCAVIIQLHGRKKWTVFSPEEVLPIARCEQLISRDQLGEPVVETELAAGDVLYVPRGFPHCAATSEVSSLHLTLSLRTMTWVEIVDALCRTKEAFRRSVRPAVGYEPSSREYIERELRRLLASIDVDGFVRQRSLESRARLRPVPNDRLRAIDQAATIDGDTAVRRASQVACVASEEDGQAVLRFPGETLRLPAVMKPVFDFVVENEMFTARELPAVDAIYEAEEFTRILVRKGLLSPLPAYATNGNLMTEEQ